MQSRAKTRGGKRRENPVQSKVVDQTMADAGEIKALIAELQKSLSGEIKDFRAEFKAFRVDTERDIKKIMQQTKELRQEMTTIKGRTSELEERVSQLEDENATQKNSLEALNHAVHREDGRPNGLYRE